MAKNLFLKNKKIIKPSWVIYKNSLSNLESKQLKNSFKEIITSIDTLTLDANLSFGTNSFKTKFNLFSTIKMGEKGEKVWNTINKLSKDQFTNPSDILEYSSVRLSYFSYFSSEKDIKIEFRDSSTFILKKEDNSGDFSQYGIYKKSIIKGNPILLYNSFKTSINSKEMAYFYFNLINNYTDL
ncbi:hypothetical protein [Cellulophaga sp. Z1A5H]|uniref:hypothetical protein n=1 Tax=Cellulophaga sp. Z1A5H TaxID=2687291 RepID=UPI00196B3106|nr:hypothetical protein [Cellulophaga sp. Z1A5H]